MRKTFYSRTANWFCCLNSLENYTLECNANWIIIHCFYSIRIHFAIAKSTSAANNAAIVCYQMLVCFICYKCISKSYIFCLSVYELLLCRPVIDCFDPEILLFVNFVFIKSDKREMQFTKRSLLQFLE